MSQAEVKEVGPCKHQFTITVTPDEIDEAWSKCVKDAAASVSLPGFRRGKVPTKVIESRFSKELEAQVKESLVGEHFEKAVKDKDMAPLSEPHINDLDFDRKAGLNFSATVEVRPEFELKSYKGIKIDKEAADISDDDIEQALEGLRRQRATLEKSDKPAKEGDHLTAKAEFTVEGDIVLTREHAHLHAGRNHIQEITVADIGKKLIGAKAGDTIEHEAQLDDSFSVKEHRGKTAKIKLAIEEVKVEVLPEIDEDFLKTVGCETSDELKSRIKDDMLQNREAQIREEMGEALMEQIAKPLKIDLPEDLLRRQSLNLVRQSEAIYTIAAKPQEEQEAALEEEIKKVKDVAGTQVRNFFILEQIADKEKIFVTEREVAKQVSLLAMQRGQSPEEMMKQLKEQGGLSEIRLGLRERKTIDWLIDKADVTEVAAKAGKASADKKSAPKKKSKSQKTKKAKENSQDDADSK